MARILHVIEAFGGGVVTYLDNLTRQQCASGNEVYIAYGLRDETPVEFEGDFDSHVHWVRVEDFKRNIGMHDLRAARFIACLCDGLKPDVVHAHSSKAGVLCRLMLRGKRNVKLFYTPHSYAFLMTHVGMGKRLFYGAMEWMVARIGRCTTIACGRNEYDYARRLGGKCALVCNGVMVDELQAMAEGHVPDTARPVVGIVARILAQKNPEMFNQIALMMPDVRFVWIGDGMRRAALTAQNIEITGWLSHEEGIRRMSELDVYVQPSKWEGLSMSLLEAMAMKKLCVVSNIPSMSEVIHHGVNGFVCRDAEDYVAAIRKVIDGSVDYNALVNASFDDVRRNYNAADMAAKYEKIYSERC